jgi:hypothetical protein
MTDLEQKNMKMEIDLSEIERIFILSFNLM